MVSRNIPYFIGGGYDFSGFKDLSVKDQKKMLKLTTFGKVSYGKAKRAKYGTSAYKAVAKYQKKAFKPTLRVLR